MYTTEIKKTGISKVLLEVNISKDVVTNEFKKCYEEVTKEAELPGFRKGKVPSYLIKQRFENKVHQEVLQRLLWEYYINALREKQLVPVEHPEIEIKNFSDGTEFIFTAEFEIKPKIAIGEYRGLKITKENTEVKPEEIERAVNYLTETKAEFSPVLELRPVQEGDFLLVDYSCCVDSNVVDKRDNALLSTKDTASPKEFINQIIGANIGEEKEVKIVIPPKFNNPQLAGKEAVFCVKIKDIKKKILPSVNDEFAKSVGFDFVDELKAAIVEDLKRQKENQAKIHMQEQLIDQLLKKTCMQVPENMLKHQTDLLIKDTKNRLENLAQQEKTQLTDEFLAKELKPEAEKQLKTFFILDKIAENENISASDDEVNERINILAIQTNQELLALRKQLEGKGAVSQISGQIRDEKTLNFLLKEADIQKVN